MSPKTKKILLLLGGGSLFCLACCLVGYFFIGPTSIVGKYQTSPLSAGDATYDWEFKESGTGTLKVTQIRADKPDQREEIASYQFNYNYVRGFPSSQFDPFAKRLTLAAHYLGISGVKAVDGKGLRWFPLQTDPGQEQQIESVVLCRKPGFRAVEQESWYSTSMREGRSRGSDSNIGEREAPIREGV
jgi:hypothetical protein